MQDLNTNGRCISLDLLYQYLERAVTKSEAKAIEIHLNSCETCFHEMASLIRHSHSPATDSEKRAIEKIRTITVKEQVDKILEYCGPPPVKKSTKGKSIKIIAIIKNKLKEFFDKWIYTRYIWRPVVTFFVLFIFIAGAFWGIRYYNTTYKISRAGKLLLNNHRIHIEDARLSGGYSSTGISMLMAPDPKKIEYIEQAKSKLDKAIKKDTRFLKANRLLAQVFIIEKLNSQADSVFSAMGDTVYNSAALLNDRGVLYFQQRDWKKAALHFQLALEIDKNFLEAYYNLALVKMKLGELEEAISILNIYVKSEQNGEWRDAAHRLINTINREIQALN